MVYAEARSNLLLQRHIRGHTASIPELLPAVAPTRRGGGVKKFDASRVRGEGRGRRCRGEG
jgi:hypothetical protein